MKNSKIEWCHHTVNFWWGCTFATLLDGTLSEECRNCYALLLSKLFSRGKATWGLKGNRWIRHERAVEELMKLDRLAAKAGERHRVFINSMSDTFEDRDDLNEARSALWNVVPHLLHLDLLLLTKRPQNVNRMVPQAWQLNWPANVWVGTTCGTQAAADERVPALLKVPAKVRFLSCEPLLGPVNLNSSLGGTLWIGGQRGCEGTHHHRGRKGETIHGVFHDGDPMLPHHHHDERCGYGIGWVICGGESGSRARPMHPDWSRALRDQCAAAGVPFFFKQWGEWLPMDHCRLGPEWSKTGSAMIERGVHVHDWPDGMRSAKFGKKIAGRILDGVEHNGFPAVQ